MVKLLEKCCYCCSLINGCFTISGLISVLNIKTIFLVITILVINNDAMHKRISAKDESVSDEIYKFESNLSNFLLYFVIFIKVASTLSCLLIVVAAANKRNHKLLYLYLVSEGVWIITSMVILIRAILAVSKGYMIILGILLIIYIGVHLYCWIVILSYFLVLLETDKKRALTTNLDPDHIPFDPTLSPYPKQQY